MINLFGVCHKGLSVLIRHIFQGYANLIGDTVLIFCLRKCSTDGLLTPGQSVCTDDQNILGVSILQAVKQQQPVFCTFILPDFNRQDVLLSFEAGKFSDHTTILYRTVGRINKKDCIYVV